MRFGVAKKQFRAITLPRLLRAFDLLQIAILLKFLPVDHLSSINQNGYLLIVICLVNILVIINPQNIAFIYNRYVPKLCYGEKPCSYGRMAHCIGFEARFSLASP